MCFHNLIIHVCTGPVEPQFIVIIMIYIIHLLLIGRRAWMAFYDKTPMQIFEPVKQKLTEHGAVLYTFFVLTA